MRSLLLLSVALLCGGCLFLPLHRTLTDAPPFNALVSRTLVTVRAGYIHTRGINPPLGDRPNQTYCYSLEPVVSHGVEYKSFYGPHYLLPAGTKLRITKVLYQFYGPLPTPENDPPYNEVRATIISGPYAGTKIQALWGNAPQQPGEMFAFDR